MIRPKQRKIPPYLLLNDHLEEFVVLQRQGAEDKGMTEVPHGALRRPIAVVQPYGAAAARVERLHLRFPASHNPSSSIRSCRNRTNQLSRSIDTHTG